MTVTELKEALPASVAGDFFRHFVDFHQRAMTHLTALPGVEGAAWVFGVPLTGDQFSAVIETQDSGHTDRFKDEIIVPVRTVSPEYFDTMGMHILAGRNFGAADNYTNRIFTAIVNQVMADRYFADQNAIGKKFRFAFRIGVERTLRNAEIIGVAANTLDESLTKNAEPEIYLPYWQFPHPINSLIVRASVDPQSLIAGVEQTLRTLDPTVAIENVRTLKQIRHDSIAPQLFAMRLLTGFSFLAAALALIGIYGVLALSVASRQKEMAIRLAVGAQQHKVFGLILAEGMQLTVLG
ncbi:MAG: ABC transporter permease, partial [Limisphaerales bacterium]